MKKILFITGTRADYGKIKSIMQAVDKSESFEAYIFASGMHLVEKLGYTYREIEKDHYKNLYVDFSQINSGVASYDLGNVICNLTGYIQKMQPDIIVVHGDRIDALAGSIVGALNNILVAHIEGGELSGTIDDSIRHAVTKFAHIHFACNEDAKERLLQLGEIEKNIYIIGSPDIDIMLSNNLPSLEEVKKRYEIPYAEYAIFIYHPVVTEVSELRVKINEVLQALKESEKNYVIIYPNNDMGSEIILEEYNQLKGCSQFCIYSSLRFEYFLTLLKKAEFLIGNSSTGIHEAGVYGLPVIDIGTRQQGRYYSEKNIQHVPENREKILNAISQYKKYRIAECNFGRGDSTEKFLEIINDDNIWNTKIQKVFVDLNTSL